MTKNGSAEQTHASTFATDFRRFFLRGLAGLVPPLVTLAIMLWAYNFIDRNIGQYVTQGLLRMAAAWKDGARMISPDDALKYGDPVDDFDANGRRLTREYKLLTHPNATPEVRSRVAWQVYFKKNHVGILGFFLSILLIYLIGYFLASFIGRSTWQLLERTIFRVPLVKAVYPHVKQVTDLVLSEKKMDVSAVVAVQFPQPGMWALGLVVGPGVIPIQRRHREEMLTVFLMSSPTPFTGYPLCIRRSEVVEMPITLDEALRFVVSCGVVAPGGTQSIELRTKSPWREQGGEDVPAAGAPLPGAKEQT